MGASSIHRTGYGKNIQEAWKKVQEYDKEELGNDSYNGGANNCDLIKDLSGKMTVFEFREWTEENYLNKRDAVGICISKPIINSNKIKTSVETYPQKGARKWITRYAVYEKHFGSKRITSKNYQTDAIEAARNHTEKTKLNTIVMIEKVLIDGEQTVAEISYKRSGKEKDGVYEFYAMAPD